MPELRNDQDRSKNPTRFRDEECARATGRRAEDPAEPAQPRPHCATKPGSICSSPGLPIASRRGKPMPGSQIAAPPVAESVPVGPGAAATPKAHAGDADSNGLAKLLRRSEPPLRLRSSTQAKDCDAPTIARVRKA